MNRILGIVSAMLLALLILVPAAAAADPVYADGRVIVSVRGNITFPAGQTAASLVVVDGTAIIEGDVRSVVVVNGTANFVGSHSGSVVAIASHVALDSGSVISGDVNLFSTSLDRASGTTIQGSVREGFDVARVALFIGPALFFLYLGFVVLAMAAAIVLAGLASRQVRSAERLISREPATTLLAGLAGLVGIIVVGSIAIVTIVVIPLGLAILVGVLPLMLMVGYLVAAIWIGEWILRQSSQNQVPDRPYLAAIVGTLVMGVVSIIPVVGGLVSFIGFGAVVLLMWRTFRGEAASSARSPRSASDEGLASAS